MLDKTVAHAIDRIGLVAMIEPILSSLALAGDWTIARHQLRVAPMESKAFFIGMPCRRI